MVRIIIIIYSIFIPFNLARAELSEQEKIYFNFFDFNKDEHVSFEEIKIFITVWWCFTWPNTLQIFENVSK